MKRLLAALAASAALAALACGPATAAPLPEASPRTEGFAPERLARLDNYLASAVARGDYLGAVALVLRNGRIVDWQAWGHRDTARRDALPRDAIFRIDAMSRAVTAAAVLILMEEGRLNLDDAVAAYLPELRGLRLADGSVPRQGVTIRHLLSQTAGFDARQTGALDAATDLDDYVRRLAALPLAAEPGSRFQDDAVSTAVAGKLVEAVSGLRFDAFLYKRLLQPLAMRDTGFVVAPAARHRIAALTTIDANGALVAPPQPPAGQRITPYLNGAIGLYSTAGDYARFAQMLLDGGELDGRRVLGRKSVELMMQNHLSHLAPPTHDEQGAEGYGLGGGVVLDLARRGRLGSLGQFGWTGAQSTWFTVDRQERLVAVLMLQHLPQPVVADPARPAVRVSNLLYQALAR